MSYVIIGNSAAAIGCVAGIRKMDKNSPITIISDEKHHTYSRPLISYWLQGKVAEENMYYREKAFYENNGCKVILGKKVVKIDPAAQNVVLDSQDKIKYDKLLVATGSSPFMLDIEGLNTANNVFTFLDWDSAQAIKKVVTSKSRVAVIGAGLIGLKAAEALNDLCEKITVIDISDKVLPSILDADGAEIVKKHIESKGIEFMLNESVTKIDGNHLVVKSGAELNFDVLILAAGVRPNTGLVKDAGAPVNRGIVVDHYQKTSLDGIYAAGDCVESYDITAGQTRVLALLPNAFIQGEIAGENMAGGCVKFEKGIPMNAIGFFGLHMMTAGSTGGMEIVERTEESYKKLIVEDGLLKGFILIGEIDRAGIYTSLIREQTPLGSVDIEMLKAKPQLLMFDKKVRRQKLLGG